MSEEKTVDQSFTRPGQPSAIAHSIKKPQAVNAEAGISGRNEAPMCGEDIEAIEGMNKGDFTPVAGMLRLGSPLHPEVRLLLAEFLVQGNSRGRLKFTRRNSRPPLDEGGLVRMSQTHEAVAQRMITHPGEGVVAALRFVSANIAPFRSFEAVRADYYEGLRVLEQVMDDHNVGAF